ncbi:MAG: hypothetical protein PUA89_04335 [Frisingicoccus sp.]|uniref:hypothetical protein n=1 Tax=Frisingicoccus sp. TaxID=1918627 RepID=UPI0026177D4C|nr:hypothetical protein [Frisingicoccus sp.]MDD6231928.1 hypothetical protein [Frisingicoccus sp.]
MLLFSTTLRVKKDLTRDRFLALVYEWHKKGNCFVAEDEHRQIIVVRFEKKVCKEGIYSWEYTLNLSEYKLSVRVHAERVYFPEKWRQTFRYSTPGFLKVFIEDNLLELDHKLKIASVPTVIDEENIEVMCRILKGEESIDLPIIYIPMTVFGRYPVSAGMLAYRLKGAAHVVVPKTRKIHDIIKETCCHFSKSAKYISVLFPKKTGSEVSSAYYQVNKRKCLESIIRHIFFFTNAHHACERDTYQVVWDRILREKAEDEKAACMESADKTMKEAEQIVSAYEEDIECLNSQLYEKDIMIQGLTVENERLRRHMDSGKIPVLYFGKEREFYNGEIQDLILSVLEDALQDIPDKTRKKDIISDIISSNNYKHISKDRNRLVKNMLKSYDGMNGKLRSGLEELGFRIEESKKHLKITYFGDERYFAVFGSTPSDVRCGKNNAAMIVKMAY